MTVSFVLQLFDLIGTFVFALAGATAGVRRRLDIFGVLVLSLVTASAGGVGNCWEKASTGRTSSTRKSDLILRMGSQISVES